MNETAWVAFVLGGLVGFVLAGVVRLMRDDDSGYGVDTSRPRLTFYDGQRAGVELWRRK